MTRLDPGPAPTMVSDFVTWPFVIVVVAIVLVAWFAIHMAVKANARDAALDDLYAQDVKDYYCAGHGHKYVAVEWHWLCSHCGDIVRQPLNCGGGLHRYVTRGQSLTCTVCGFRTALPFDQEASA